MFEIFNISAKESCLSKNWKFFLGDIPEAKYVDYDDSEWGIINIPHDWAFLRTDIQQMPHRKTRVATLEAV